jgi:hypothetical protein
MLKEYYHKIEPTASRLSIQDGTRSENLTKQALEKNALENSRSGSFHAGSKQSSPKGMKNDPKFVIGDQKSIG